MEQRDIFLLKLYGYFYYFTIKLQVFFMDKFSEKSLQVINGFLLA